MNQTIDLIMGHRSIRSYADRAVPQNLVETIVRAGQAASTSSFIQACTLVQVSAGDRRSRLAEYAGNQAYVAKAPVFLVVCADMQRHRIACDMHAETMRSGYTEQFVTATVDCALFAQNMMVAAESLGLGGVYIGGIRNQIGKVAELLELPNLVYPVFGLCLGYPAQEPDIKPRLPLSVVLKHERYDDSQDKVSLVIYDKHVRDYYARRLGNNKQMSWTEQIAAMLRKESRPHMRSFLQGRGFLLK